MLLNMNEIYEQGKSTQGICFEIPEIEDDGMLADRRAMRQSDKPRTTKLRVQQGVKTVL